jgi:alkanesulfonate monooxygenase SsuD/methylene tetrahydromethanopterin reductase-like flavin-dependent oxidoreductase (luciferase family)
MRFGIFDHFERHGPLDELYEERLRLLEIADAAGFWCYHKAEHHFTVLDAAPSSSVFLAAASQRTERIRLGSLVLLLPFYDPIRLIEELSVLDHLSRGRLEIGVGKGVSPVEHRLWGMSPEEARDRFEETFEIVRKGLGAERLDHDGERYRYRDVPIRHQPCQAPGPRFWYPGNFHYAGEHRLSTIVGGSNGMLGPVLEQYQSLLTNAAHDWSPGRTPMIGVTRHVYVAESEEAALDRVRTAFPRYNEHLVSLWDDYGVEVPGGSGPALGGDTERALAAQVLVAGSPETLRAHIRDLVEQTGVDYFVGAFRWGDLSAAEAEASMRLFADEVMPGFGAAPA